LRPNKKTNLIFVESFRALRENESEYLQRIKNQVAEKTTFGNQKPLSKGIAL